MRTRKDDIPSVSTQMRKSRSARARFLLFWSLLDEHTISYPSPTKGISDIKHIQKQVLILSGDAAF